MGRLATGLSIVCPCALAILTIACGEDDANVVGAPDSGATLDGAPGTLDGSSSADGSSGGNDGGVVGDGGGGDGAPIDAGYDPHVLPGLALWLESTKGKSNLGGYTWADQSGNGNDAMLAAGTEPPDSNTAGSVPNGIGFHGYTTLEIEDSPSLQWGTGDFLVEVVTSNNYNLPGPANEGTLFSFQDGSYKRYRYAEVYSKIASSFGPGPAIVFNDWSDRSYKLVGTIDSQNTVKSTRDTEVHLIGLRRKGDVLELRKDGAVAATRTDPAVATTDVSVVGTKVRIGGRPDLTHHVGGIWEVVAVKGTVSDADLALFEAYAKTKYKL